MGLSQAVAGAAAVALVFRFALDLLRLLDAGGRTRGALAAGARAAGRRRRRWGSRLAPGAIMSANRPEVYALATALALGALLLAFRGAQTRRRAAGAAGRRADWPGPRQPPADCRPRARVPAALAALPLLRAVPRGRLVAGSFAALGVGLLVLAYLPVRARREQACAMIQDHYGQYIRDDGDALLRAYVEQPKLDAIEAENRNLCRNLFE